MAPFGFDQSELMEKPECPGMLSRGDDRVKLFQLFGMQESSELGDEGFLIRLERLHPLMVLDDEIADLAGIGVLALQQGLHLLPDLPVLLHEITGRLAPRLQESTELFLLLRGKLQCLGKRLETVLRPLTFYRSGAATPSRVISWAHRSGTLGHQ